MTVKVKMTSSAIAMMIALSACGSSTNTTATPATPATPVTPVTPTTPGVSKAVQSGTTITLDNGITTRTKTILDSAGYRITSNATAAAIKPETVALDAAVATKTAAEAIIVALSALSGGVAANTNGELVQAQALVAQHNGLLGRTTAAAIAAASAKTDLEAALVVMQGDVAVLWTNNITTASNALLTAVKKASKATGFVSGPITLADGTKLKLVSQGRRQATNTAAVVSARTITAYETDGLGRIEKVAFVETTGIDYVASAAVGTYSAKGTATFAVKADGAGFFEEFNQNGNSTVDINLATELGDVYAEAKTSGGAHLGYNSTLSFNTATGAFEGSNGSTVYTAGTTVITENNAGILGQLHGEIGSNFGADYTGVVTADTGRLEIVGSIIGNGN